jgi:DHA1 family bicyclomycin/chloramphenicol resistance-like MFS transporter
MKVIGQVPPILLYCLISLSTLTETIYSAALPIIAAQLNTDGSVAQLSTTAYYSGFALGVFTLGRISDIYGRKPVVLFGISFYIIATFTISKSTNIEMFILFRFAQAYGASVGSVIAQAMTRDSYKGWELSYIYASVAAIMAFVPSIGSALGGYIIEYFDQWQYIFYFLTLLSSILLCIYVKFLPETNAYTGSAKNNRFFTVLKVALRDRTLLSYAFIVGVYNGICFGFYIQAPFIFIEKLEMSPSNYGKLFLLLSAANLSGGLIARRLIRKFVSTFKVRIAGFILSAIGCIIMLIGSQINTEDQTYVALLVFGPMAIHLMGHAMVVPMLLRHALEDYHKVTGSAGSIFGSMYYLITAGVSFMIATFHSNSINNFAYLFSVLLLTSLILFYYSNHYTNSHKDSIFN